MHTVTVPVVSLWRIIGTWSMYCKWRIASDGLGVYILAKIEIVFPNKCVSLCRIDQKQFGVVRGTLLSVCDKFSFSEIWKFWEYVWHDHKLLQNGKYDITYLPNKCLEVMWHRPFILECGYWYILWYGLSNVLGWHTKSICITMSAVYSDNSNNTCRDFCTLTVFIVVLLAVVTCQCYIS